MIGGGVKFLSDGDDNEDGIRQDACDMGNAEHIYFINLHIGR